MLRKKLSFDYSFNTNEAFRILDMDGNRFLTMNEFKNSFKELNLSVDYEELLILMDRYDRNKDGRISYYEVDLF